MSAYGVFTSKRLTARHLSSSGPGAGAAATDTLLNKVQAISVSALDLLIVRNELRRPVEIAFFMVRLAIVSVTSTARAVERFPPSPSSSRGTAAVEQ